LKISIRKILMGAGKFRVKEEYHCRKVRVAEDSNGLMIQVSGPHSRNFFCNMYEYSLRHPVWVAEINITACNRVIVILKKQIIVFFIKKKIFLNCHFCQ
jgi:hypothetical protein